MLLKKITTDPGMTRERARKMCDRVRSDADVARASGNLFWVPDENYFSTGISLN